MSPSSGADFASLHFLPTRRRLILLSLLFILITYTLLSHFPSSPILTQPAVSPLLEFSNHVPHPLPSILANAEAVHRERQQAKSTNLAQAVARYQRTHDRSPPLGFDEWFERAKKIDACNVDDFSVLHTALLPFLGMSGEEVRWRNELVGTGDALGRIRVKQGKLVTAEEMDEQGIEKGKGKKLAAARALDDMVERLIKEGVRLPDFDLFANSLDEPRVTISHALRQSLEGFARRGDVREPVQEKLRFRELKGQNPYPLIRLACPPGSPAFATPLSTSPGSHPHITHANTAAFTSPEGQFLLTPHLERSTWCDQPDLQDLHQTFIHPLSWMWTGGAWPVFSNSKMEGFADIPVPAWYYWQDWQPYRESEDAEWEDKDAKLFWRGTNTGGLSVGTNWRGWLRSRLVSLLNRPATWQHTEDVLLPVPTSSPFSADNTSFILPIPASDLNAALTDVAFTAPDQGDAASLALQREEPSFRFSDRIAFADNYKSQAILDMDGTAYSGRFLALMESKSAVFKSRLYIEAIEDSLVPWYHFVPVSIRFSEVYNLLGYFFGVKSVEKGGVREEIARAMETMEGRDEELKLIAERGREWAKKCARKEDQLTYLHLLILEWARILSDDREAMSFHLQEEVRP